MYHRHTDLQLCLALCQIFNFLEMCVCQKHSPSLESNFLEDAFEAKLFKREKGINMIPDLRGKDSVVLGDCDVRMVYSLMLPQRLETELLQQNQTKGESAHTHTQWSTRKMCLLAPHQHIRRSTDGRQCSVCVCKSLSLSITPKTLWAYLLCIKGPLLTDSHTVSLTLSTLNERISAQSC